MEGLISSRNRFVKTLGVDFEDLSLSAAIKIISENPQIMRRPIIMDEKRLHVGYNEEEIRAFTAYSTYFRKWRRSFAQCHLKANAIIINTPSGCFCCMLLVKENFF